MEQNHSLTTDERRSFNLENRIKGWGADLNPEKRPGVPRDQKPELGVEALYPAIEPQTPTVRIFKSTEHERMPPVFGTSTPPRGVSGALRAYAYRYSEGKFAHWLTLLLADRIDVVESIVLDLSRGRLPNFWKEMGLSSELKYNRKSFQRKATIAGVACLALAAYLMWPRKENTDEVTSRS